MNRKVGLLFLFLIFQKNLFSNSLETLDQTINEYLKKKSIHIEKQQDKNEIQNLFRIEPKKWYTNTKNTDYFNNRSNFKLPNKLKVQPVIKTEIIKDLVSKNIDYKVKPKDTLYKISRAHQSSVQQIRKLNGLEGDSIKVNQTLRIPVKVKSEYSKQIIYKKTLLLPIPNGRITSRYGKRNDPFKVEKGNFHSGIDIAGKQGSPVIAAADGKVVSTGLEGGYGNKIILEHSNGIKTVYAHLATILVEIGDEVNVGKVIGAVGRTGSATGSHLHFEVFKDDIRINPSIQLKKVEKIVKKIYSNPKLAKL